MRILTYNVRMLPGPGGEERGAKIAHAVADFDVVCFNELFDEDIRVIFVRELGRTFPYAVAKAGRDTALGQDSGLAVFSKAPILESRFDVYDAKACHWDFPDPSSFVFDCYAAKGALHVRLKNLDLFATHTQSDNRWNQFADVRRKQARQLKRFIGRRTALIVGDLNVPSLQRQHQPEYRAFLKCMGDPIDAWRVLRPNEAGATWDTRNTYLRGRSGEIDERLDYALAHPSLLSRMRSISVEPFFVDGANLSDHFGLALEIA